jgi:hypothetical protein
VSGSSLHDFARAYMHQDLDRSYGDIAGAARAFVSHPTQDVDALLAELKQVLVEAHGDQGLHRAFDKLGAHYQPGAPGRFRRELLAAVGALEEAAARRRLLVAALQELLQTWYSGENRDEHVVRAMARDCTAALRHGLQELLTWARTGDDLCRELHELTGERVVVGASEVKSRLEDVLLELDQLQAD